MGENGWRKSWKGHWKDQAEGCVKISQGWSAVPRRKNPSSPQEPLLLIWSCRSHCCCVQLCHSGVPNCRGARVGRQRFQGLEGEEDHPKASPARHQRRRGGGHADQGYHCWWWCHPSHPQVSHWQEGRRWPPPSPLTEQQNILTIWYRTVLLHFQLKIVRSAR